MSPIEDNNDLNIIKCRNVEVCFLTNNDYPELLNNKVSLEEINKYPLILPVKDFNDRTLIDDYANSNNMNLNPSLELSSYGLIRDFTMAGFGIGILPEIIIEDDIKVKKLNKVDVFPKIPQCYIAIVDLKKKESSFSVKKLIDIIKSNNDIIIEKNA